MAFTGAIYVIDGTKTSSFLVIPKIFNERYKALVAD